MRELAYDTETTAKRRQDAEIFSYSLCDPEGLGSVNRLDGHPVRRATNERKLRILWEDISITKVCHNTKFDLGVTEKHLGRTLRDHNIHDTMLMSHILRNDHPSHALDDLAWELAGYTKQHDRAIKPYTRGNQSYQNVPEPLMHAYQNADAERGMLLYLFFWPKIKENKDYLEIYENERALVPVTIDMENRGVMLNVPRCKSLIDKLIQDREQVLQDIERETSRRMKPGTEEFRDYLYTTLELPIIKRSAKTLKPSLEKEVLGELYKNFSHIKVLDLAMRYTSWSRGISMLESYLLKMDNNHVLHPNIRTCAAITAREACADPNLQNVEKDTALLNPYPVPARTVFQPRPGYVNFHGDYSGQEMRGIIHYSGEPELVEICRVGGDLHAPAATIFFGDRYLNAEPKLKKTLRDAAKNGQFCIAYGGAADKLASTLGLSVSDAMIALSRYKLKFPMVVGLMKTVMKEISLFGYITTSFGRRLYIPRSQAYMGVNYMMQNLGAELIKRGQVRIAPYLLRATSGEMQMLLPIHDELIIECPRRFLKDAREVLVECSRLMTDFGSRFKVPFEVEWKVATTDWSHKSKFSLVG